MLPVWYEWFQPKVRLGDSRIGLRHAVDYVGDPGLPIEVLDSGTSSPVVIGRVRTICRDPGNLGHLDPVPEQKSEISRGCEGLGIFDRLGGA
jgi:hypothetical protein